MLTIENVKARAATHQRVKIRPTVVVEAKTPEQKRQIAEVAQRVIREHYDVFMALKNR